MPQLKSRGPEGAMKRLRSLAGWCVWSKAEGKRKEDAGRWGADKQAEELKTSQPGGRTGRERWG